VDNHNNIINKVQWYTCTYEDRKKSQSHLPNAVTMREHTSGWFNKFDIMCGNFTIAE